MNLVERVKGILLQPKSEWEAIAGEDTPAAALYRGYIIPLAAIGPVASVIGLSMVGIRVPMLETIRIGFFSALGSALTAFALALAGVYLIALIIDTLAPYFASQKNPAQALKVAAYSATPGWLAGVFQVVPSFLGILAFLVSLYGIYLLYLGLQALMRTPREKSLAYTAVVLAVAFVVMLVIGWVSRLFLA